MRAPAFPWVAALVPTLLLALCLAGLVVWCQRKHARKVSAPRLRKKESYGDVLRDFVDDAVSPMEDLDPEIVMNPVLLARMQMEKEAKGRAGRKKGKGGAQTGGLARLGLRAGGKEESKKEAKPLQMQMDEFLHDAVGLETRGGGSGVPPAPGGGRTELEKSKKLNVATERIGKSCETQASVAAARGAARDAAFREREATVREKL